MRFTHAACLSIISITSPGLPAQVTTEDMSNDAFPFRTAREIDIGFGRVLCTRITYVGELGYELFIPTEQAVHVYDRLAEFSEGADAPLTHVGLKALGSLRLEKVLPLEIKVPNVFVSSHF